MEGTQTQSESEVSQGGSVEIHAMLRQLSGRNIVMLNDLQERLAGAINDFTQEDSSANRGKMLALAQVYGNVGSINVDHLAAAVMYFNEPPQQQPSQQQPQQPTSTELS